jgi:NAD(P)-dependent dehydrogenase (short-subunit alcohol dehydrogenase family)
VEAVQMDLADLSSIRSFASKALDGGRPLDVLINNAGASYTSAASDASGLSHASPPAL